MPALQAFHVLGQVIHLVFVMQNDGHRAVIGLHDQPSDPVPLLLGVVAVAHDKTNAAAFEHVSVGDLGMLVMLGSLVGSSLPGGVARHLRVPDGPPGAGSILCDAAVVVTLAWGLPTGIQTIDAFGGGATQMRLQHSVGQVVVARGQMELNRRRLDAKGGHHVLPGASIGPLESCVAGVDDHRRIVGLHLAGQRRDPLTFGRLCVCNPREVP